MKLFRIDDWSKGLNKDSLASELEPGFCSDAQNMRFRDGFAERVGGVQDYLTGGIAIQPEYMEIYASSLSANGSFLLYAGTTKVYAHNQSSTNSEITRYTDSIVISSITRVGTTATLTTSTNHGRTTGDSVTVYGATPSQYNGTYTITVTGVTTFTYTMASDPGASASPVGAYSYNVTSNFTGGAQAWTGGALNGVYILNNSTDGLYYWGGDVTQRLRKFPLSNVSLAARVFGNYIVQLGSTVSGTVRLHNVAWSASAEPGTIPASFVASDTNDAGDVDLAETAGRMVDCMPWGDINIIYKEDGRFGMQYIGGNDVFRFWRLPGDEGLLSTNCIANTPKGQVFITQNYDVMIHTGGAARSIAQGRIRSILKNIDPAGEAYTFLSVNPKTNEVWLVYKTTATALPTTALIWNWDSDTWGTKTLLGMVCGCYGTLPSSYNGGQFMLIGGTFSATAKVGIADYDSVVGVDDFGSAFESYIERTGLSAGDPDSMKTLHRSRWNVDGPTPALTVYHGSAATADAAATYAASVSYTITDNFAAKRAIAGRYLAVKAALLGSTSSPPTPVRVRSCDLEYTTGGRR